MGDHVSVIRSLCLGGTNAYIYPCKLNCTQHSACNKLLLASNFTPPAHFALRYMHTVC
jgi:hypothetical protein